MMRMTLTFKTGMEKDWRGLQLESGRVNLREASGSDSGTVNLGTIRTNDQAQLNDQL